MEEIMGYKEYLESVGKTSKEQSDLRHKFFAEHPELAGMGKSAIPEQSPEPEVKQIITHIHIDPRTMKLDKRLSKVEVTLKGISNYLLKSKAERGDKI